MICLNFCNCIINTSSYSLEIYKLGVFLLEIIANRRPHEEFEGGEAGFIEYVRMHYPANLQKAIDEKMKLTENGFEQAKQVMKLGIMCTDRTSNRQQSLKEVFNILSRAYKSFSVFTSPNHKRSHGDRG